MTYIGIIITYTLVQNLVLVDLLGLYSYVNVTRRLDSAAGLGLAMVIVMSLAALLTWVIYHLVLLPLGITFLQILTFLLIIVGLVQILEMITKWSSGALHSSLGSYLPMLTVNCAVLGIALIAVNANYSAFESLFAGFSAGIGFLLVTVVMASIRERLDLEWIPKPFRGIPIAFVSAGLMAMAFLGFDTAFLRNLLG
ncbi:MAG TPA: Rnf-Nqr domain containing protein [Spirochaetia bacterium]|nr:Rnf-Nqr domain containing protein [Spirochaetia bacterium]